MVNSSTINCRTKIAENVVNVTKFIAIFVGFATKFHAKNVNRKNLEETAFFAVFCFEEFQIVRQLISEQKGENYGKS